MKRTQLVLTLSFTLVILIGWVIWQETNKSNARESLESRPAKSGERSPGDRAEIQENARSGNLDKIGFKGLARERQLDAVFGASIVFYGKVVDENGTPVEGAKVEIGAADGFWADGSDYLRESDARGLFSIQGIKGAGIYVNVSKEGYYRIPGKSYGRFGYGMPSGKAPHDDPNDPAVFIIRKKGEAEYLIHVGTKSQAMYFDRDEEVFLDLATGKNISGETSISVSVETDYSEEKKDHYTWFFILKITGGGFIERVDEYQFEAPENGYEDEIKIGFSAGCSEWRSRIERDFFVKLSNGLYGRFRVDMWSRQINGFGFKSYVNPSGSRNLEYDSKNKKPIK